MREILEILANKKQPNNDLVRQAFITILEGAASDEEIKGFLLGMNGIKLTADYITIGAQVLRQFMENPVKAPDDAIDVCGTGGDSSNTYNISTATALVVAACGVPVAKHGNRSVSSNSGSSEVLEELGVKLSPNPANIEACINDAGIGFMFAPNHHPAMRHAAKARKELGVRTIFNFLGPLANPASVKRQLVGISAGKSAHSLFADIFEKLGTERAMVFYCKDTKTDKILDELSTTGTNYVDGYGFGFVEDFFMFDNKFTARDVGLPPATLADIKGSDPAHNARAITTLLDKNKSAYRDVVLLNAGAALVVADKAERIRDGIKIAKEAIDSGEAEKTLAKLIEVSNKYD